MKKFLGPIIFGLIILVAGGLAGYQYLSLYRNYLDLNNKLASTEVSLGQTRTQNTLLAAKLQAEQAKTEALAGQVSGIASTVSVWKKLQSLDPELLKKYSKVYFLNENYKPASLTNIDPNYLYNQKRPAQILTQVTPYLNRLINAAASQGVVIDVVSVYRSFFDQYDLKTNYKVTFGVGANKFSADQGYSEHQLGTAVDFGTPTSTPVTLNFTKTNAYTWLLANAYKYGFELSYPQNNSYYQFEPWHWRFVGVALATYLHDYNQNFYDLDQRLIDSYLVNIFD